MANRWGSNGNHDFIFLGSKITVDGDYCHEIKRRLLLGRKAMTNLDSILKSRDITFPIKVNIVKAMVFPVVMYGCESRTIKKAEHQRIDAWCFWAVVSEKTSVHGVAKSRTRLSDFTLAIRRSNQSILKEMSPEYSLEGLMLTLKLQYLATWCKELTHWKRPWCWERLKEGAEGMTEDEMVGWHHQLNGHELEQILGNTEGQGSLGCCSSWSLKVLETTDWTITVKVKDLYTSLSLFSNSKYW